MRNTGDLAGTEVVQLYLRDPVAQIARPVRFLAGFARVELEAGECRRVVFRLHADRTSFHGVAGTRVVEPGLIEVGLGSSSTDLRLTGELELCGPERHPAPIGSSPRRSECSSDNRRPRGPVPGDAGSRHRPSESWKEPPVGLC